mmetsp:Transcript_11778/g.25259  ORF Transcript_11778/g.25259 Transcript_11778/m.25259 type:complete len:270 (+) Transcript_11778:1282-2091(+)
MRLDTWHSRTALAALSTGAPVTSPGVVSSPASLSSPGWNDLASRLITTFSAPSGTMLTANLPPTYMRGSMLRSFLTDTVMPGGSKLAWEIQEASMAPAASSTLAVMTAREPTTRPMARVGAEAMATRVSPAAMLASLALSFLLTATATSRPLSVQVFRSLTVGLNLTLMGWKANLKPASLRRCSISSTASPLQPKLPNTPHGSSLAPFSRMMEPRATCTWVGMWPPRVGLPITKPLDSLTALATSSGLTTSRLSMLTATPPLVMPRLMA